MIGPPENQAKFYSTTDFTSQDNKLGVSVGLDDMNAGFNSNVTVSIAPKQFQNNQSSKQLMLPIQAHGSTNNPIKTVENLEVENNSPKQVKMVKEISKFKSEVSHHAQFNQLEKKENENKRYTLNKDTTNKSQSVNTRNENINPAMTAGNDVFALLSYQGQKFGTYVVEKQQRSLERDQKIALELEYDREMKDEMARRKNEKVDMRKMLRQHEEGTKRI